MSSGDNVVKILSIIQPGTLYATPDIRVGGSTPAEEVDVHDFDDTITEYLDFKCVLQGYDGGGLTFTLPWSATTATTNNVRWGAAIRRINDDAEDIDAAHTYAFNDVAADDPAPSVSGEVSYPTITFTDGTDMDDWADGEIAIVRVRRTAATSNMTGDAELWGLVGKET